MASNLGNAQILFTRKTSERSHGPPGPGLGQRPKAMSVEGTQPMEEWAGGLKYTADKDGKEMLLDAEGGQVMMEWERPYMVACVNALKITLEDDVLEVSFNLHVLCKASHAYFFQIGFGCAYSADRIQHFKPK